MILRIVFPKLPAAELPHGWFAAPLSVLCLPDH